MTVILLLFIIILAVIMQSIVLNHGLDNVTYNMSTSERIVECDQIFTINTVLENRKLLPVMFLRIIENYPITVSVNNCGLSIKHRKNASISMESTEVSQTLYMLPNQRLTRTIEASFPSRGIQIFRYATLTSGDLLGLKERSKKIDFRHYMIVLPKKLETPDFQEMFGNFLGDMSVRRFILEDPVLTLSFRDYTGREPMKDISWSRSLREGRLMVKQYDYTMELSATVILNTEFFGSFDEDTFERTLSITRGVCEYLDQKKTSYNFRANTVSSGISADWTSSSDGLGKLHLMSILEGLGCATQYTSRSFTSLMESAVNRAETARTHILISVDMSAERYNIIKKSENIIGSKIYVIDVSKEVH